MAEIQFDFSIWGLQLFKKSSPYCNTAARGYLENTNTKTKYAKFNFYVKHSVKIAYSNIIITNQIISKSPKTTNSILNFFQSFFFA